MGDNNWDEKVHRTEMAQEEHEMIGREAFKAGQYHAENILGSIITVQGEVIIDQQKHIRFLQNELTKLAEKVILSVTKEVIS